TNIDAKDTTRCPYDDLYASAKYCADSYSRIYVLSTAIKKIATPMACSIDLYGSIIGAATRSLGDTYNRTCASARKQGNKSSERPGGRRSLTRRVVVIGS